MFLDKYFQRGVWKTSSFLMQKMGISACYININSEIFENFVTNREIINLSTKCAYRHRPSK